MLHLSILDNEGQRSSLLVNPLSAPRDQEDFDFPMAQVRPERASMRAGDSKKLPLPGKALPKSGDLLPHLPPADCLSITTSSVNGQSHLEKSGPLNQPAAFVSLLPASRGL